MPKKVVTPSIIKRAGELAYAGFTNKQIHEALRISSTAFYDDKVITDTVKEERARLREEVASSLLANATSGDTASTIFLSKRLGLHQASGYKKGPLKTPQDAITELGRLYDASDEIPQELFNSIRGVIMDFVKMFETVELESEIQKITEFMNEQKGRKRRG